MLRRNRGRFIATEHFVLMRLVLLCGFAQDIRGSLQFIRTGHRFKAWNRLAQGTDGKRAKEAARESAKEAAKETAKKAVKNATRPRAARITAIEAKPRPSVQRRK